MAVGKLQPRPAPSLTALSIAASALLCGAAIGASTNAINGAVSPDYFRNIMRWDHINDIWRASIAQVIFEGLLYGVLFSLIFIPVVTVVSGGKCPFARALRYVLTNVAVVYCCWIVGGLVAMGSATLSPEFYRNTLIGVPESFSAMLCYAWVGGSIWGALFGGLLGCVVGSLLFATHWRQTHSDAVA